MESTFEKDPWEVAEIQLSYKPKVKASQRPTVTNAADAYEVFRKYWNEDKIEFVEDFNVMILNRARRVLGIFNASSGGRSGTVADPKVVFAGAIARAACSIIVAHNHPSGNTTPSEMDLRLTRKLKQGGELLDIPVLDHIIMSSEGYTSLANEGLM